MPEGFTVSVVATVQNEAATIDRLLDSLAAQDRQADQIVVVDGGSTDGTAEALERRASAGDLPLVVLYQPGANISAGRNAAIAAARGPVIASTDGGVRLDPGWLAALAAAVEDGARSAAGFFASDPVGPFETALGAATLPETRDVSAGRFLPSSRSVAFRKDDWATAGGYPEWLDYCEDLVFDLRLRRVAGPPAFVPEAVAHFRPRPDLGAFARQYRLYARGDGKAGLWPLRHAVRYATYLVVGPALLCLTVARSPLWGLGLMAGAAAMVWRPYRRLSRQWSALGPSSRLVAAAWVPVIRVTGDLAKMAGYPAGLWWRWRRRPPAWRPAASARRA
jgi:glycosyltransferase involved in cell wall biosynthesis